MKDAPLRNVIYSSNFATIRVETAQLVLANEALFPELFTLALDLTNENHHKACWVLEIVLDKRLQLITDSLPEFCSALSDFTNDSATRAVAKICMFISRHLSLTVIQEQQITESCFDWLITTNKKVATKVYAARALYELGKTRKWIYPELERILTEDYPKHSAAYKAAAREILKKIK
jgi:hypothetical protein